jgi:hypothetical protein
MRQRLSPCAARMDAPWSRGEACAVPVGSDAASEDDRDFTAAAGVETLQGVNDDVCDDRKPYALRFWLSGTATRSNLAASASTAFGTFTPETGLP